VNCWEEFESIETRRQSIYVLQLSPCQCRSQCFFCSHNSLMHLGVTLRFGCLLLLMLLLHKKGKLLEWKQHRSKQLTLLPKIPASFPPFEPFWQSGLVPWTHGQMFGYWVIFPLQWWDIICPLCHYNVLSQYWEYLRWRLQVIKISSQWIVLRCTNPDVEAQTKNDKKKAPSLSKTQELNSNKYQQ
jgi:hypothetical protein